MKELQELFNHCAREIEKMHQAIESDDAKRDSPDVHGLRVGMLFAYEDIQSKLEKLLKQVDGILIRCPQCRGHKGWVLEAGKTVAICYACAGTGKVDQSKLR